MQIHAPYFPVIKQPPQQQQQQHELQEKAMAAKSMRNIGDYFFSVEILCVVYCGLFIVHCHRISFAFRYAVNVLIKCFSRQYDGNMNECIKLLIGFFLSSLKTDTQKKNITFFTGNILIFCGLKQKKNVHQSMATVTDFINYTRFSARIIFIEILINV